VTPTSATLGWMPDYTHEWLLSAKLYSTIATFTLSQWPQFVTLNTRGL